MTDPDPNNETAARMQSSEWKASIGEMTPTEASQVTVTVLGGGIAGLTAAHELIHRGFKVRLIERSVGAIRPEALTHSDALHGLGEVDLGGVARSQWTTDPKTSVDQHGKSAQSLSGLGNYTLVDDDHRFIYGGAPNGPFIAIKFDESNHLVSGEETRLKDWLNSEGTMQLVALNYEDRRTAAPGHDPNAHGVWGPRAARERAETLLATFSSHLSGSLRWMPAAFVSVPIDQTTFTQTKGFAGGFPGVLLRIHHSEDLLPGEHGFRFFPGFYWHIRDTMMRTPVYDFKNNDDAAPNKEPDAVRTHRSVHDNLNEVEWQIMADPTRSFPTAFRRKPPSSVEEFIEQWQTLRNDLGFRESDMLRFILRLGRFAASAGKRRREQYARMSWWDFVSLRDLDVTPPPSRRGGFGDQGKQDGESATHPPATSAAEDDADDFMKDARDAWKKISRNKSWDVRDRFFRDKILPGDDEPLKLGSPKRLPYGLRFRRALRHSPRALVAMDGLVTDAHTQGMLAIQLAMDQLGLNPMTDSTLNGPTSDAWFRHWHQYLKEEGVTFIPGEVTSIDVTTGRYTYTPLNGVPEDRADGTKAPHYTICALDPVNVARLLVEPPTPPPPPMETRRIQHPHSPPKLSVKELIAATLKLTRDQATAPRVATTSVSPRRLLPLPVLERLFVDTWQVALDLGDPDIREIARELDETARQYLWERATLCDDTTDFVKKYRDWVYDWRPHGAASKSGTTIDPQNLGNTSRGPNKEDARFQVLSGIQLFFKRPTAFEQGHIYFAESPWGLMGMSQLQHWRSWNARPSEIRGNLSLVYGSWRAEKCEPGDFAISRLIVGAQKAHPFGGKIQPEKDREAWCSPGELTGDQLAEQTRKQIAWCRGTDAQFRGDLHVPEITYYHIDDCIQYRGNGKVKAQWNLCPYLINLRDDWNNRPPGEPWNPNRRDGRLAGPRLDQGYRVHGTESPLVFAGAHTRTFTRMATMEAANESARHAVNSVLWHLSMRREAAESILMAEIIEAEINARAEKEAKAKEMVDARDMPEAGPLLPDLDAEAEVSQSLDAIRGNQKSLLRISVPMSFFVPFNRTINSLSSRGGSRPRVRQSDLPVLQTSWFGDFCEVRDHEDYEIPLLDFFKTIDGELYRAWEARGLPRHEAAESEQEDPYPDDDHRVRRRARPRRPHLFDLLKLDNLPDRIDSGELSVDTTLRTLYSMGGVLLRAVRGPEPVKSVLNLIDSFDALFVGKQKP